MDLPFPYQSGAERLIATTRAVVAITVLLIIWLDPFQATQCEPITYAALGAYAAYALGLTWFVQQPYILIYRVQGIIHVFDMAAFAFFTHLTATPLSLFFLYYAFALLAAMLRWHRRGIFWTALAALLTFVSSRVYGIKMLHGSNLEPEYLVVGAIYIAMLAALLGYMATYGRRVNHTLAKLVTRPRVIVHEPRTVVSNAIALAADILQAPRVLIIWEEREEPWVYLALWSSSDFSWSREPPPMFEYLVTAPLVDASFLCLNTRAPLPKVFYTSSTGLRCWHGRPLHPDLQKQLATDSVLSSNLRGAVASGRIFFLDNPWFTPDDLAVSDVVARQVAADLDQALLAERREQAAVTQERQCMIRNLHDGLLQSLAGMALQLSETHRLLEENPSAAREHVLEVQRILANEQRDLRFLVSELKTASYDPVQTDLSLSSRLETVRRQIQHQWGLRVDLSIALTTPLPTALAYEIYYIAHEALVNAARHAQASTVRMAISLQNDQVRITIADDGRGFPFHGRYTLAALAYLNLGPVMLRERIASLGGALTLESTAAGAQLDVVLPLTAAKEPVANMSSLRG